MLLDEIHKKMMKFMYIIKLGILLNLVSVHVIIYCQYMTNVYIRREK